MCLFEFGDVSDGVFFSSLKKDFLTSLELEQMKQDW